MDQERLPKPGEVLVCSEENHAGQQMLITADTPDLEQYFPVASFRLGARTGVTLFPEKDYQGPSQQLTAELASFEFSRLQGQTPKSLKIWSSTGKPFTGYWAIEVAAGRYLSVYPDQGGVGVLRTSLTVTEREAFSFEDLGEVGPGRRMVACRVRGTPFVKPPAARSESALTIDDLARLTLVDEIEAGFRKFSLLTQDDQWICYEPEADRFVACTEAEEPTIFCLSVKIAEDETQVGELFQGEVALFEHPGYWGKAWVFYTDYPDFERVVNLNNEISSIQLGPLTGATIYREPGYTGGDAKEGKQDITTHLPALAAEQVGDNQISSLDLWRIVPPAGLGITIQCRLSQDFRGAGDTFEEYTAYRTTITLPVSVETVDVWTTDETQIEVEDHVYPVAEDHRPVTLRPNLFQCLMITTDAFVSSAGEAPKASLRAPGLKIRTNTMLPHERIVIYPDQEVHTRLANLEEGELWDAKIKTKDGSTRSLIADRTAGKKLDVANTQTMITKVMSTVRYDPLASGGWSQAVSPTQELMNRAWKLDFYTYRVTATTLYVRPEPGMEHKPIGYLCKNDLVKPLDFSADGKWMCIRRLKDGLEGWSSVKYLDQIVVVPPQPGEERCRVTVKQLHVREGPGVEYRSLGVIKLDETITVLGVSSIAPWKQIRRSDGLTGWSSSRYLAVVPPALPQPFAKPEGLPTALPLAAVAARPLPEISGLTPEVRFQNISLDEVQALLARAESPDTKLAQWSLDDLVQAVKSAVSVVITQVEEGVEKGVAIIVELANEVKNFVIDTTHKIVAFVEGVFEKIGLAINDLVDWLKFVFDWDDILATKDHLAQAILESLDYLRGTFVENTRGQVKNFFANSRELINAALDKAILALGGDLEQDAAKSSFTSQMTSSFESSGVSDAISWVVSKVLSGVSGGSGFAFAPVGPGSSQLSESDLELRNFLDNTFVKGLDNIAAIPAGMIDVVTTLMKKPDQPLLAVARLLAMIRDQLIGLVDAGEGIVLGLLDIVANLIDRVINVITSDIRIPFISDILEWMGKPALSLGFSLLDLSALILAIPLTIVSKALFKTLPFQDASALAQGFQVPPTGFILYAASYLCSSVSTFISTPLDCMTLKENEAFHKSLDDKAERLGFDIEVVVEWMSMIPSIASFALGLAADALQPESDDEPQNEEGSLPYYAERILPFYEGLLLLIDFSCLVIVSGSKQRQARLRRQEGLLAVIASILGVGHILLFIVKDWKVIERDISNNFLKVLVTFADVMGTLPDAVAFIRVLKTPQFTLLFWIDMFAAMACFYPPVYTYFANYYD